MVVCAPLGTGTSAGPRPPLGTGTCVIGDRHMRRHMRSSRNNFAFNRLELLVVCLSPLSCPHRTANLASRDGWVGLYRACPYIGSAIAVEHLHVEACEHRGRLLQRTGRLLLVPPPL